MGFGPPSLSNHCPSWFFAVSVHAESFWEWNPEKKRGPEVSAIYT